MKKIALTFGAAFLALQSVAMPAQAQSTALTPQELSIVTICANPDLAFECEALISGLISSMGFITDPVEYNNKIGLYAGLLVQAAQTTNSAVGNATLARMLNLVASASRDAAQQQSIAGISTLVAQGDASLIDLQTAFAASPA